MKLHVAGNHVWYVEGASLPTTKRHTIDAFIDSGDYRRMDSVRIMGTARNSELIAKLFGRVPVELITPLVCPTAAARDDPAMAMYYMRQGHLAPSQGGFHTMEPHEQIVYTIAAMLQSQSPENWQQKIVQIARLHPAWHAWMFPRLLSEECLAGLLGVIIDPRWYVNTNYPDRSAKLCNFLGLNPKTQAGVSLKDAKPWRNHTLCQLVTRTWYSTENARSVLALGQKYQLHPMRDAETCAPLGMHPRDFLWRIWQKRFMRESDGPTNSGIVAAELRASQSLISFLRLVWLAAIYDNSPSIPERGASLFRADDFFDVVEADAYKHYILCR